MVKGNARKIDRLGRVTLPIDVRRDLHLNEGDFVDVYRKDGILYLEKAYLTCVCCGARETDKELIEYEGVHMCKGCLQGFEEGK